MWEEAGTVARVRRKESLGRGTQPPVASPHMTGERNDATTRCGMKGCEMAPERANYADSAAHSQPRFAES
jgi:hypothetical protein